MTTLVLTRPCEEAGRWQAALSAAGWPVFLLPLIEIVPPVDTSSLAHARTQWDNYDAVMFVSAQAVSGFFRDFSPQGWPGRCWVPGPGTQRVLQEQGVPPGRIDAPAADAAQFDSEALWAVVQSQVRPGHRLLVVRGNSIAAGRQKEQTEQTPGSGRDWLAQQCVGQGGQVDWCVAYQRRAPVWDDTTRAAVGQHNGPDSCWLFSSSEAVGHLRQLCPGAAWHRARALVTHPRIAAAVRELGFGEIITSRPALSDVLRHLESLH